LTVRSRIALAMLAAAGCDDFFYVCPTADPAKLAAMPATLSETGLYADIETGQISPDAREYQPRFELWSDAATKQRWIAVPEGARIDTTDPDSWVFPAGTRVFKEFSFAGIRVETRLLEKLGPGEADWGAVSYRWRADGSDADSVANGAVDPAGTGHDIPGAGECAGCHGGRRSFVLGYSAIQLGPDQLDPELLTEVPGGDLAIPGDPGEVAALGYLHANCGNCHNQERPGEGLAPCMNPDNELDFWLRVDRLGSPEQTPTYETAIGFKVTPGDPDGSRLIERVSSRDLFFRMPPLGSDRVDRDAVDMLRRWIAGLEP
jgi:hypothetical protein